MKIGFRWFGDGDYPLEHIRQIPRTTEVVWSLHSKAAGELWTEDEIEREVKKISEAGLEHSVVESVNIHESIKIGSSDRDKYIEIYKQTIENLSKYGVKVICYNFMPIFDWTRTELKYPLPDGSTSMYFDYSQIENINPHEFKDKIIDGTKDYQLPGWEEDRLDSITELFDTYSKISRDQLWDNLKYFLDEIIPICEKCDVKMAIHPDDPGFEIFGLSRMIATEEDIKKLFGINKSEYNGLTFCTGSLGSNQDNNLVAMLDEFIDRTYFVHLRNLKFYEKRNFQEVSHLAEDGNIDIVGLMNVILEKNYKHYLRPDHGRHLFDEECRPGYGMYDRAFGIMYINGITDMYKRGHNEE